MVVPHGIYAKDSIKTVADLKGKQIAVSAPNSMPDMLARFGAGEIRRRSDKDVKLAAVGGDRDRYQALIGGVVDGRGGVERIPADRAQGRPSAGRRPRRRAEFPARVHDDQRQDAGRRSGDDAVKFLAAEMNALHYALSHKAETVALTDQITHAKPDDPRPAFVYDDAVGASRGRSDLAAADGEARLDAGADDQGRQAEAAARPARPSSRREYREKALKLAGS